MSDWDSVTVIRKTTRSQTLRSNADLNAARRSGLAVESEKKAVHNTGHAGVDAGRARKIEEEEVGAVTKVNLSVAKAIQQARTAKGLNQKDFATKINEKSTVVNEYESGKAIPNQQILGKMERVLGVKLRGKDIGAPLAPRGSKK